MGKLWGRLYSQTRNHRKLVALSRKHPQLWMLFYVLLEMAFEADDDGKVYYTPSHPYTLGELAEEVRVPPKKLLPVLETMHQLELIVFRAIGIQNERNLDKKTQIFLQFPSYSERQFKSDLSTERTRRFKEKQRLMAQGERSQNVLGTLPGTPQNRTDTDLFKPPRVPLDDPAPPPTPPVGEGASSSVDKGQKKPRTRKSRIPSEPYSSDFLSLKEVYPNLRGGIDKAWKYWQERIKLKRLPPIDYLLQSVQALVNSGDWQKEGGKWIPWFTTFIEDGRWTDADALQSSKRPPPNQPDPNCPYCQGRGHEPAERDGVKGMTTCRCRRK